MKFGYAAGLIFCLVGLASGQWIRQKVDTAASFRGISVVNEKVVWASGTGGTVIRTVDGGASWRVMNVAGAEKLDFRDIEAFDADTAFILSIGNGPDSRIYRTGDGGASWQLQFTNTDDKAFYDAIACWDPKHCVAMSDPVDGRYRLIATKDGESWTRLETNGMPPAGEGEAAFAASGTCLVAAGKSNLYLVSGGGNARVFRSRDRGKGWTAAETSMPKGTPGSGIFSITMRDAKYGIIVGGDFEEPDEARSNMAITTDGGRGWSAGGGLSGYRSAVAFIDRKTVIAVGPNGTDYSADAGKTWKKVGSENLNAVAAKGASAVWAAGPRGLVVKLRR